jgi:hypothetical protein
MTRLGWRHLRQVKLATTSTVRRGETPRTQFSRAALLSESEPSPALGGDDDRAQLSLGQPAQMGNDIRDHKGRADLGREAVQQLRALCDDDQDRCVFGGLDDVKRVETFYLA